MPILGTVASQFAGKPFGSFESIATTTVGSGGSASITFSSIPGTYTHLQIRGNVKSNRASNINDGIIVQYNSDTGSNYTRHRVYGQGGGAAEYGANISQTGTILYTGSGGATGANIFAGFIMDLLDYTNTNKYKTMRALDGIDANGSGIIALDSGLWINTAAVTTITLTPQSGSLFVEYSHFALYGIKGA
jgi:hypothetical protein